jgi:hypothetical protein
METKTAHGLKVISNSTPVGDRHENSPTTAAAQQSLFPLRNSRTAIFVSLPDVDHCEFVSLLKNSGPAVVVELRKIPRFDFGPLNRGSIFDLFREQGDTYLDLGQSQESDQHLFASRVEEKLQVHIKQHRPIVFLTSPAQNPPSLAQAIYRLLRQSGEGWEIYEMPHNQGEPIAGIA